MFIEACCPVHQLLPWTRRYNAFMALQAYNVALSPKLSGCSVIGIMWNSNDATSVFLWAPVLDAAKAILFLSDVFLYLFSKTPPSTDILEIFQQNMDKPPRENFL